MNNLSKITAFLDQLLDLPAYQDYGINGLQVEADAQRPVDKVALAVDSGLSVLQQAVANQAQLLIVHHGLFWGAESAVVGPLAQKLKLLLTANCSLYAAHLPLDGHLEVGNAAQLAKLLGCTNIQPAFKHHQASIGIKASIAPTTITNIVAACAGLAGSIEPLELKFGPTSIKSLGIVTGSGTSAISEAHNLGLDLLISGEPQQKAYHLAKELRQNVLFIGHYASETLGVKALGEKLSAAFDCDCFFIDEPTGI